MKSIFYLLTILFLSLLLSCSEEPPTYVESETLSKKPVPPPPPTPLPALVQGTNYIAGSVGGDRKNDPKVFIWNGNDLSREWTGSIEAFTINGIGIGNFVGDSDKELIVQRRIVTGKKRNEIEKQELLIFEKDEAEPTYAITLRLWENFHDAVWDMKIGDVDNDGAAEIVILFRDQIEIWEYDGSGFSFKASREYYSSGESPWTATIGDFDNNTGNGNEIIVAFTGNMWRVYKDNETPTMTLVKESSSFNEIGNLNCAKMFDVDSDGDIEVIGGNYPNKVLLWETPYINQGDIVASQEFSNAAWAIGIGELDGDPLNGKILAGVISGGLHLLPYDGILNSFGDAIEKVPGLNVGQDGIIVIDIDNNGSLEIVVKTGDGLRVFDNNYSDLFVDDVGSLATLVCQ